MNKQLVALDGLKLLKVKMNNKKKKKNKKLLRQKKLIN